MILTQNMGGCQNVLAFASSTHFPTPKNPFGIMNDPIIIAKGAPPLHQHKCSKCTYNNKNMRVGGWGTMNKTTLLNIN